jgi:predicted acylesterase/phospholipase RssA
MTIKHLVISGGGPLGLRYLGALEKLEQEGFWQLNNIESIYGTSIGSIIGAFICLKYDWDTLNTYIIERPWNEVFKVNVKQIFDSYYNKGLFNKKLTEIIFKPLLEARDLSVTITLKEFYEYSKIELHIFTFELHEFKTIELTHKTHPELPLLQALTMSSSLPGIFMPTIMDGGCYIDGGVMCNYPINYCLKDHVNKDEILGINLAFENNTDGDKFSNVKVTQESSLLEYVICITLNSMNYIRDNNPLEQIQNTVRCFTKDNPLSLDVIQESIKSKDLRQRWIQLGQQDAVLFLTEK